MSDASTASVLECIRALVKTKRRRDFDQHANNNHLLIMTFESTFSKFSACEAPELFKEKLAEMLQKVPLLEVNLSLVVDVISDDLLITVMHFLPRLELDLEDRPFMEPSVRDMTNIGLPALKFCECLIVLSIVRSERNYPSFKRVKNIGMFHVSERCRRLESVKLGGFAKVTEAGYSSILHSCRNLKKFEVLTLPLLSDSVFDNMIGVARNGLLLLGASALTYLILWVNIIIA
ncbi:F-box protein At-B [Capsicum chinense]|nr:F-box protein At-B [Capsicum chinense]